MMENKRDLSAVVWLRDKSLCSWYLFFAHIQVGGFTPVFMLGTLCPDSSRSIMSSHGHQDYSHSIVAGGFEEMS